MGFSDNLQYLRKQHQMTQEQLAERLEVSRQSVSKWESGAAYPETEKLLILCDMFFCTLDDLLRGEVKARSEESAQAYDKHMRWFAKIIPTGVGLAIWGLALRLLLQGIGVSSTVATMAFLMLCVVSVTILIVGGMQHGNFVKNYTQVDKIYAKEEVNRFEKQFIVLVAGSIALIMLAIIFRVGSDALPLPHGWTDSVYTSIFMFLVAIAVSTLIYAGLTKSRYNVEEYNKEHGPEQEEKKNNKWEKMLCGVIMLSAALAFLLMGFLGNLWHIAWVVYPAGGILCGIVSVIANYKMEKNEDQ
ncbi:MAG TPA: helix-turn-helix transcriptional regulator [Clostridiales bacterium]|jgi:transcriptional regulator with XRE-family HTH domain|nr:helix-turn-helix transcriptional regulator [Clostridiales bacterium]